MAILPKDIYRGRRTWKTVLAWVLVVLAILIALVLGIFYGLQRYVVVTQDGVELHLPFLEDQAENPGETHVPVDVVMEAEDYSQVRQNPGASLSPLRACYMPFDAVTAGDLDSYLARAASLGAKAIVLELKSASGSLAWSSEVSLAQSYGAAGSLDLAAAVETIREAGLSPIGELACCTDQILALRKPDLALKTTAGTAYTDSSGYWLNPYHTEVRGYVTDLARELFDLGLDEVILTGLAFPPVSVESLDFSQAGSGEVTPAACVGSFSAGVLRKLGTLEAGQAISVSMEAQALRDGAAAQNGQDPQTLFSLFDRVYVPTDLYTAAADREIAAGLIQSGSAESRLVSVIAGSGTETGSCLIQ